MRPHIFSVWGFMSLPKSFQIGFTSNHIPWVPNENDYYIAHCAGIKSLELRIKVWNRIYSILGIDNI